MSSTTRQGCKPAPRRPSWSCFRSHVRLVCRLVGLTSLTGWIGSSRMTGPYVDIALLLCWAPCLHLESRASPPPPPLIDLGRSSRLLRRAGCLWGLLNCDLYASGEAEVSDAALPCWATKTPSGELDCKVRASGKKAGREGRHLRGTYSITSH